MATPSSSATSASPPMSYLQPNSLSSPTPTTIGMDPAEREQRKKAVQKFLARAEISMVTRALRARLSYASYKAIHNIPHVPLRDLEAQTQSQSASFSRTIAAKRKNGGSNNYYNNPATQGSGPSSLLGPRRGAMAPPPVTASRHYPSLSANTNRNPNVTQSLYTSLLAPPPAKQARTIHNASDPPLAPPKRPSATPRSRRGSKSSDARSSRSIAESTRAQAKNRKGDPKSRSSRKDKKGKQKERPASHPVIGSREDADVDMKAAATLTSLLLHSRPVSSPRPSTAGSAGAPAPSYSHFGNSLTRVPTAPSSVVTSADSSFTMPRSSTPPPLSSVAHLDRSATLADIGSITPKTGSLSILRPHAPTNDTEAADLMLFLATSPSPARPSTTKDKDAKDMAAFRTLGGNSGLRAKGRVLFPSADATMNTVEGVSRSLTRVGDSFNTSISSIGSQLGSAVIMPPSEHTSQGPTPTEALTTPMEPERMALTPAQLLPPPASPQPKSQNTDSSVHSIISLNPWPSFPSADPKSLQAPPTPGNLPFNFNDFINVSPSPAPASTRNAGGGPMRSSLRADVGRKLFEEEQQRHLKDVGMTGLAIGKGPNYGEEFGSDRSGRGGSLGAGIDLVQS